jgi:hypothetical protein
MPRPCHSTACKKTIQRKNPCQSKTTKMSLDKLETKLKGFKHTYSLKLYTVHSYNFHCEKKSPEFYKCIVFVVVYHKTTRFTISLVRITSKPYVSHLIIINMQTQVDLAPIWVWIAYDMIFKFDTISLDR